MSTCLRGCPAHHTRSQEVHRNELCVEKEGVDVEGVVANPHKEIIILTSSIAFSLSIKCHILSSHHLSHFVDTTPHSPRLCHGCGHTKRRGRAMMGSIHMNKRKGIQKRRAIVLHMPLTSPSHHRTIAPLRHCIMQHL